MSVAKVVATMAVAVVLLLFGAAASAAAPAKRPITLEDYAAIRVVGDPQVSADGEWVAYTVETVDKPSDDWQSDLWLASWDGQRSLQLTNTAESETTPRFSPDGRSIAFLSARDVDNDSSQLWLLSRAGGEAERITDLPGGIVEFAWAPDSRRVVLVVEDPDPNDALEAGATRLPIVIDRFYFKEDITGYLGKRRRHLYLLDLQTRGIDALTPGDFDEIRPSWSPDGRQIAFLSKRTGDWDRNNTYGVYLMAPQAGAAQRLVTTFDTDGVETTWLGAAAWSPDGRELALAVGGDPKLLYYATHRIAVVPVAGGEKRIVTGALDRNVEQPKWSPDGKWLYFMLEDDGSQRVARVRRGGGRIEFVSPGREEVLALSSGGKGRLAVLRDTSAHPLEVYALDAGRPRPLSRQNDALFATLDLAPVEEMRFESFDGTEVMAFVAHPRAVAKGKRHPPILNLPGGPAWQFAHRFEFGWQLLAANGYAVIAPNPRGSTGKGEVFSTGIYADWGNHDTKDVLAAVDTAVARGFADADRLGVSGRSYGGILTTHVIARDQRFKAAISDCGQGNPLAGYGTDQYIREYEAELGTPWSNLDTWLKVSFPFLQANRITTPTLFVCAANDFNVPLLNSEQMYQALRSLNVPTQLIIYPDEFHELSKLSNIEDRARRQLEWFARYVRQ